MIFTKWPFLAWKLTRAITEQQGWSGLNLWPMGFASESSGNPRHPSPPWGFLPTLDFVAGVLLSCIPLVGFLLHYVAMGMLNGGGSIFHPLPFRDPPVITLFMVALGPWRGP